IYLREREPPYPGRPKSLAAPFAFPVPVGRSPLAPPDMIVAVAARRLLGRSLSLRPTVAARIGASRPSLRPLPRSRPAATASRFPRSPVETSFCLESLLPIHNATASALMTSMLTISRRGSGWLSEAGKNDDV
ncbi:unnamed protein product, partial [Musa hybrid cultivar]